ncbi:unnamed protein product [Ilex paraguariensis]|uniref:Isopropylmalate dehydrogenase-like domain-containing protein n=1 Tax=Ilex paraguariensis TaxID=185542 RepID=A0ABC8TX14_9AQUA
MVGQLTSVFRNTDVPIEWEERYVRQEIDPRTQSFLTLVNLESVRKSKVSLKGSTATPIGKGHHSLNLTFRKELNLYANVRLCYSLPGYKTWYDDVTLITIHENTEGEYSGLEHQASLFEQFDGGGGLAESLKIITRQTSLRVAEYAFHYPKTHGMMEERECLQYTKLTSCRKLMDFFDGLPGFKHINLEYPEIKYEEVFIDNCCMMGVYGQKIKKGREHIKARASFVKASTVQLPSHQIGWLLECAID